MSLAAAQGVLLPFRGRGAPCPKSGGGSATRKTTTGRGSVASWADMGRGPAHGSLVVTSRRSISAKGAISMSIPLRPCQAAAASGPAVLPWPRVRCLSSAATSGRLPPPPYARFPGRHLAYLRRRRAAARYAHPSLSFLLWETEHATSQTKTICIRI